jgi:acyl-CoA synthetase (AMP-forming)/AMP-acid ligase II
MVVPTMLGRILDVLMDRGEKLPALQHLSYGGGRMPAATVERALELLPHVGFVNAYGLTETSSTVSVLTPDDHREAVSATEPHIRARLASVGQPLPHLEVEIRGLSGELLAPDTNGEIWVRGEQVSGEYLGRQSVVNAEGWLTTNDEGRLDADGYLFVEGRFDDVIIRGGENLSPGEIEEVLVLHNAVADAAVIGVPDVEWGEAVVAVVVLADGHSAAEEELREWVATRLRSTRAPGSIVFRDELPYSETGKLLRRQLKAELSTDS